MPDPVYRIVDWDEHFENHASRKPKELLWVAMPNRFDGDRISELIAEGGNAVYAAWVGMVMVASRCNPRGTLIRTNGKAHNSKSLSRQTGLDKVAFDRAIQLSLDNRLMESCPLHAHGDPTTTPLHAHAMPATDKTDSTNKQTNKTDITGQARVENAICEVFGLKKETPAEERRLRWLARDFKVKLIPYPDHEYTLRRLVKDHKAQMPNVKLVTPESILKYFDTLGPHNKPNGKTLATTEAREIPNLTDEQKKEARKTLLETKDKHFPRKEKP